MNASWLGETVPEYPTRLLVALKPDPKLEETVARRLPGVGWTYAQSAEPAAWSHIEALLVGSVARELGPFDPSSTPRLRLVQLIWTGVDGFPFSRFPEPIQIAANVGGYAPFVAEHAVALALASARAIVPSQVQIQEHRLRPPPALRVLWGATAVILGYGEIGREIAHRLAPFSMRVVGVNRSGRMAAGCDAMFPAERLREAISDGDVVFDARPLTRSTRATIGPTELATMRPSAIYVNVGRAATVDQEALYHHLTSHPEFRAAFDPWWEEDFVAGTFAAHYPLTELPNFLGTPHDAGLGPATSHYVLERALENLGRYFHGATPRYVVDRSDYPPVRPAAPDRAAGP
jgi:phosphoglycerate dehydrogenase-like enzyme